jgi:2-polyprenyl-3-methyl-5-hydroxy-6-metoxy-1,4-benzoquinol methylase
MPTPELAAFPCRLCGESGLSLYYTLGRDARFRYYRCNRCSLVNYDLSTGLDQTQYEVTRVDPRDDSLTFNHDKDQSFASLSRYVQPPGRLLDIGCGNGRLLYIAKRAGWQVKGLELSAKMAESVRQELDVEVTVGNFLEVSPSADDANAFDVVILRHVLEHLPDPLLTMDRITALLKPDGYLLLEMPNVEAMTKKWSRFVVGAGLYTRKFPTDFMAGHCNEYSLQSMRFLARKTGYRLAHWETYSRKPLPNWFYNRVPIGNKARALLRQAAAASAT